MHTFMHPSRIAREMCSRRTRIQFAIAIGCLIAMSGLAQTVRAQSHAINLPVDSASRHHLTIQQDGGALVLDSTGNDPYIVFDIPATPVVDRHWMLAMEVFCPEGIQNMQLFIGQPFSEKRRLDLPYLHRAEGWTVYSCDLSEGELFLNDDGPTTLRLDFGRKEDVRFRIRKVTLRPENDREWKQRQQRAAHVQQLQQLDERIANYYHTDFPIRLTEVRHSPEHVVVSGKAVGEVATANLSLIARDLDEISALPATIDSKTHFRSVRLRSDGTFEVKFPAAPGSWLKRTGMRWQVVSISSALRDDGSRTCTPYSAVRYVDVLDQSEAKTLPPTPTLHAAKGVTCVSELNSEMIRELGLQHATVNILLNGLIELHPKPGYVPVTIRGKQVFVRQGAEQHLDKRVRMGREAGLVLAGILLIGNQTNRSARDSQRPTLQHPNADPAGVYTMPNLTDPDSANLYAITLDYLAERYSEGDLRIDHWIVHNEIDAGWQWTNMGETPHHVYLDHYFRSMRMVDIATRRINPHARTFISLTHYWNLPNPAHWRWYRSKEIMESLVKHGEVEGDFPWGMAHHPYPESLWESDTWNDNVKFDLDAKMFTLKNWSVLDEYMKSDRLRDAEGNVRPVLLSEQGFHAPEDDEQSLQQQVAAVLYTFQQLRQFDSVLAFDYHRSVDHSGEGGLLLGLRGLSSKEHPRGKPKPAWNAFRAIGTPQESELLSRYKDVWSSSSE
ncbi:DUF5722 domain-containing protein [Rhodopirellula sp. JC737]|nr:DUF5722 domain-containing protein [Rhodopirellula sp. JC737]